MSERPCSECRHYEKRHNEFPCVNCNSITDYFDAEVSLCQWIPCSERLPEEDGMYLITSKIYDKKEVQYVFYQKEFELFINNGVAIAWMPLPEPYKKERK